MDRENYTINVAELKEKNISVTHTHTHTHILWCDEHFLCTKCM